MAFFKDFKDFALKGNVMDMAVGVIIGGAFGKIVSSLVNDILMPPIGALIGNTNFSDLKLDISKMREVSAEATHAVTNTIAEGADAITPDSVHVVEAVNSITNTTPIAEPIYWYYGNFIQQCVDFTILALCVFMMVKLMSRLMKSKEVAAPAAPPAPSKEEVLLGEIRDILKEQKK